MAIHLELPITNSQSQTTHHDLYERDFCLWVEEALNLLRAGRFSELDMENLLEEIADMSGSQRNALESNLEVLLMHLLKYKYQVDKRSNSWRYTIIEHRRRLERAFKSSPSLKPYFLEIFDEAYEAARELASAETGIEIDTFPIDCPFISEQVLDKKYLPEE